jgi:uncharacterized protein YndB with AHSA1/START domain
MKKGRGKMTTNSGKGRTDSASRIIQASPQMIYDSFIDPKAYIAWLPPKGMKGDIQQYNAQAGGTYRMSLTYTDLSHSAQGKSSEHVDIVEGKFLELIPDEKIVQLAVFESDDPDFAGDMIISWLFEKVREGTKVTVVCDNVPAGITKEDHNVGLNESLDNLAAFVER